jgi:DNA-binding IscR family transcriptional regulator
MFSKTCEYALRALIYIAQQSKNDGRVGIKILRKALILLNISLLKFYRI